MADQPKSILGQYLETKRGRGAIYGSAIAEVSAVAYDLSAMMATVVPMLRVLAEMPAIANSDGGKGLQQMADQLKERFEAHSAAMAALNNAR